ncbi:MAG: Gfo/Idh/MocA family oxidoreductase [Verrucomicrobium sp.]|nr:Gfo/Idh/MocA family oxidoreductase [Verrucomicrobium sp.]
MTKKIRMGMVGGGEGAFIGAVHRMAAALDGQIELVAGAFSSDPARSRASGRALFLPEERCYGSHAEMFAAEAARPAAERIEFVSIVTPNFLHFPVAEAALRHGFPVLCDKPLTLTLDEAVRLAALVRETGLPFGLTHNYTGYPMVKEARARVAAGDLGAVRKVVAAYPQGWLAARIEAGGQKQADWRTDPARAGLSCCMGDIGTHAENLAEYVTGLRLEAVCADLATFVPGRPLDDDGSVLLRFRGSARGVLHATQVAAGEENGLSLQVYGEKGSLHWRHEEPNSLTLLWPDRPREIVRAGAGPLSEAARRHTRLPAGHPEGFLEAFANLYRNFAAALRARAAGEAPDPALDFPGVADGVRGMAFLEAVVASSLGEKKWQPVADPLS